MSKMWGISDLKLGETINTGFNSNELRNLARKH